MDNTAKECARRIIGELEGIRGLIHDVISLPQKKYRDAERYQGPATDSERNPAQGPQSHPKSNPAVTEKADAKDKNTHRFPKLTEWKPVIEFVGAIILIVYTTVAAFQLNETRKANQIARDALITGQRPWVSLDDEIAALETTPLVIDEKGTAHIEYSLTAKNYSAYGAQGVFSKARLYITQTIFDMKQWEVSACSERNSDALGTVLFSGKLHLSTVSGYTVQLKDWVRTPGNTNEEFLAFMVGCIYYADQFRNNHHTAFNYRLSTSGGGAVFTPFPQTVKGEWRLMHSFFLD